MKIVTVRRSLPARKLRHLLTVQEKAAEEQAAEVLHRQEEGLINA